MLRNKKKTKKRVFLNGIPKKIEHDVYLVLSNQEKQLTNHESALLKFAQIYEAKKRPNKDETILYEYCMQLESVINTLKYIKEQKDD